MNETDFQKTGFFTQKEKIKKPDEIRILYKEGKKVSTSGAKLFYKKSNSDFNRIAFTLPRGYGNAVQRNHSKRVSREAYRHLKSHLNTGYDIILLVYPGNDSFRTRCEQLRYLFRKAGLLSL